MVKRIGVLFFVIIIAALQVSCTSDHLDAYETSVGVVKTSRKLNKVKTISLRGFQMK